jgi:hypothetical protein
MSIGTDSLGPFIERKQWSRAIAERLNFNESNGFRGYSASYDPLSRLEIAHKLKKIKSCGNVVELRSRPGDTPTVHNFQKCGQVAVCPVCASRAQAMRKKRFASPIESLASLCGGAGVVSRRAVRPSKPVPLPDSEPFKLLPSCPWPGALDTEPFESLNAYLITATIRPRDNLRDGLNHLTNAWKSFRKMGQRRGDKKRSCGEFGKVVGALAKIEIKRGSGSGKWHPHIHALVFTRGEIDFRYWDKGEVIHEKHFDELITRVNEETGEVVQKGKEILMSKVSKEWLKATGGDSYNIDVSSMRKFWESPYQDRFGRWQKSQKARGVSFAESVREQASEVLKYATKWNADPEKGSKDFDASDFVEVVRTAYCRRLFATYGYFRRIPGSDFVGNESGEDLFFNSPGGVNPEIYSSRWTQKGFSDLQRESVPLFSDSDPLMPLMPWEYGAGGVPSVRENPRSTYLRRIVQINGNWRRLRFKVLKMKNRAAMPFETEHLLNRIRERATNEMCDARIILKTWYQDAGPSAAFFNKLMERYRKSKEYSEKLVKSFLEVLQGPNKMLVPA